MRWLLLLLLLTACAEAKNQARLGFGGAGVQNASPHAPQAVPSASIGAAVGAAAISRAAGGCVAMCMPGTTCNQQTGFCDTLPCRGACKQGETCENEKCVPELAPKLFIGRDPNE